MNYPLFNPPDAASLFHQMTQWLPALRGMVAQPATTEIVAMVSSMPAVSTLFASLRARHPEAGPLYWGSRTWSLLIWQPVYLAVLSVHLTHRLPALDQISQQGLPCFVAGFSINSNQLIAGQPEQLLPLAGAGLRRLTDCFLPMVQRQTQLHPKMADRLLADCALTALLLAQRCDPRLDNPQLCQLAPLWLQWLGVAGGGGLTLIDAADASDASDAAPRLALQRKVCCQNFRCSDGGLCSTCPKLSREERTARLAREWV